MSLEQYARAWMASCRAHLDAMATGTGWSNVARAWRRLADGVQAQYPLDAGVYRQLAHEAEISSWQEAPRG